MHFPNTTTTLINLLFLTTTSLQVLASPLSFTDIERRWSAGESDVSREREPLPYHEQHTTSQLTKKPIKASIHALHNPRSASPAWPLALAPRSASSSSFESEDYDSNSFAESYDAVTQQGVIGRRSSVESLVLSARIRDFATRLLRSKGESGMIAEKKRSLVGDEDEDAAPVLRPGKVRYSFTS
jgi:hypothetical protein